MITVRLKEDANTITSKINSSLSDIFNSLLFKKKAAIHREIKSLVPDWVKSQPEMIDLASGRTRGSLAAQLGLYYGTGPNIVEVIAETTMNSVSVDVSKINKKTLEGGIKLEFMPATFDDLLNLPEGHVVYDEGDLHWLKWLLLEGDTTIIVGYQFSLMTEGRSLGGIMRRGGTWNVPSQYAGVAEDNFITRALRDPKNEYQIMSVIKRHIT